MALRLTSDDGGRCESRRRGLLKLILCSGDDCFGNFLALDGQRRFDGRGHAKLRAKNVSKI